MPAPPAPRALSLLMLLRRPPPPPLGPSLGRLASPHLTCPAFALCFPPRHLLLESSFPSCWRGRPIACLRDGRAEVLTKIGIGQPPRGTCGRRQLSQRLGRAGEGERERLVPTTRRRCPRRVSSRCRGRQKGREPSCSGRRFQTRPRLVGGAEY